MMAPSWPILLLTLLLSQSLSTLGQEDEEDCINYETNDQYRYRFQLPKFRNDVTRLEFSIKAANDVHIALSSLKEEVRDMYEIVIGGWGNTRSVIRRCKQCTNLVSERRPNGFLNSESFRKFWIDFADSTISVGAENEPAFMVYTDDNPLQVLYVGFTTGWGSNGNFQFCGFGLSQINTCEGETGTISCEPQHSLKIYYGFYGRSNTRVCPNGPTENTDCSARSAENEITGRCEGQQQCTIPASNSVFGDPCRGTHKYMRIYYNCELNPTTILTTTIQTTTGSWSFIILIV
ncbi:uncharacterized protein [Antedon mediterranea]|uniref:uncharacterized protein n=1 Tax=Antedon mediterranea TaxID=105859 RepID=UPI003AF84611